MAAVARRIRKDKKLPADSQLLPADAPGVSVVLCAHNERENLSNYLQALLTQDYPTYEVIVVDDGSEDDTRAIIERYMVQDPRLHMTFVPYGARVLSTKNWHLLWQPRQPNTTTCCSQTPIVCRKATGGLRKWYNRSSTTEKKYRSASERILRRKDISTGLCALTRCSTGCTIWERHYAAIPIWAWDETSPTAKPCSSSPEVSHT